MKKIILALALTAAAGVSVTSCSDLDIPPKTIIGNEDLYNEEGIKAYLAGIYRRLPMEDFKYGTRGGQNGYFFWECGFTPQTSTGEMTTRDVMGMQLHVGNYWGEGFKIIRDVNRMIENLPQYAESMPKANEWIGEFHFLRAYVYFALAHRYGGMPIVDKMMEYDADFTKLERERSSCQDTYDFILGDLDKAIELLPATSDAGRANKYVAYGMKSRVAVAAGSIAKYGGEFIYMSKRNPEVMLCGIPASEAGKYYKMAWDASKALEGHYELHGVGASSPEEQQKACEEVFSNAESSKESIWIRKYDLNEYVHSWDAVMSPERIRGESGNRFCPTLDWMELFDGENGKGEPFVGEDGKLNVLNADGTYKVFDHPGQLYENAEPRLKANIFVPMQTYKGLMTFDVRAGVITEDVDPSEPIQKFSLDDYVTTTAYDSKNYPFFGSKIKRNGGDPRNQNDPITLANGTKIYRNGIDGPSGSNVWSTATGIHGRKYIDLNLPKSETFLNRSTQPWIDMRYAEIMLNRAEAALELYQDGTHEYQGKDLRQDAYELINAIRQRAGADLLSGPEELNEDPAYNRLDNPGKGGFIYAPNRAIQILRVERYKELAFEFKIYWDLRRWFSFDKQIYNYAKRKLNPFLFLNGASTFTDKDGYSIATGKLIYDCRSTEGGASSGRITYNGRNNYYDKLPGGELTKSDLLEGNIDQ